MKKAPVVSTLKAKYCEDNADHSGKRILSFPETLEEIPAWEKQAKAESAKYGVDFDALTVLTRGYSLLHQAPMRTKLVSKFGRKDATGAAPKAAKDVSGIAEI